MNFQQACLVSFNEMKKSKSMPFKTGRLKFHAVSGCFENGNLYHIKFDSKVAPYIEFLQTGTLPHDIPKAFGRPLPFGIGGRFDGKFHPGSFKHWMFIDKLTGECATRMAMLLGGKIK